MIETVYLGHDNPNTVVLNHDGSPIDFSAVTRVVCEFEDSTVEADTDVDANLIDWSLGNGQLVFRFNDLSIPAGIYLVTLLVFDPAHPDGQVLAHPKGAELRFKFVE